MTSANETTAPATEISSRDDGGRWRDVPSVFLEFFRSPNRTAAVLPSSPHLVAPMTAPIPERGEPVVVELGAGTGVFTEGIQRRLGGRGRHIAFELNPRWAELLGHRFPGVEVLCADANELPTVLAERGLAADVVVSSVPWEAHTVVDGSTLVDKIAGSLTEDGAMTQLAHLWTQWASPAKRLAAQMRAGFEETTASRTVWQNFPPALAYVARRPRYQHSTAGRA
jgi:phospholipid N-methyltransferase